MEAVEEIWHIGPSSASSLPSLSSDSFKSSGFNLQHDKLIQPEGKREACSGS